MSICRTTIVEFHAKEDADAVEADYSANFDSMFPEAEATLNSRVGPTTFVSNSVTRMKKQYKKLEVELDRNLWINIRTE